LAHGGTPHNKFDMPGWSCGPKKLQLNYEYGAYVFQLAFVNCIFAMRAKGETPK